MNSKNIKYVAVAGVTIGAAIVFCATSVHALWYAPETQISSPIITVTGAPAGQYPAELRIPELSIDAKVEEVGTNTAGRMATPAHFADVAWYKYGPLPGQLGSAVIDGHVDNGLGLDGVFKHLGEIKKGDEIDIVTKGGNISKFIVSDIESYPYMQVPTDLIFNTKDAARLNLITCEGNWVPGDKTYDRRLVVYAALK